MSRTAHSGITAALNACVPLRDVQIARTTSHDRARGNLGGITSSPPSALELPDGRSGRHNREGTGSIARVVTLDYDQSDGLLAVIGEDFNLIVELSEADVVELRQIGHRSWVERPSLRAGACLGHSAFWSTDSGAVSPLVGTDDESWRLSVTLTRQALAAALDAD